MKEIQALRQAFQSQKMGALLLLGFASGLPLFLTSRTLSNCGCKMPKLILPKLPYLVY